MIKLNAINATVKLLTIHLVGGSGDASSSVGTSDASDGGRRASSSAFSLSRSLRPARRESCMSLRTTRPSSLDRWWGKDE